MYSHYKIIQENISSIVTVDQISLMSKETFQCLLFNLCQSKHVCTNRDPVSSTNNKCKHTELIKVLQQTREKENHRDHILRFERPVWLLVLLNPKCFRLDFFSVENKCMFIKLQGIQFNTHTKKLPKNSFKCKSIIWSSCTQTLCNFVPHQFSSKSLFLSADWSKVCTGYFIRPIIRGFEVFRVLIGSKPCDQFLPVIGCYNCCW